MLIGFAGYAQTGKDTCADHLYARYGFQHHKFADKLKEMIENIDPYVFYDGWPSDHLRYSQAVSSHGYETAKRNYPEVRNMLKNFGMEMRKQFGEDVWVELLFRSIDSFENNIAISDVRFLSEAAAIKKHGGVVVRIQRPDVGPDSDHISETEMDRIDYDFIIYNDGDIADLKRQVDYVLQLIKD